MLKESPKKNKKIKLSRTLIKNIKIINLKIDLNRFPNFINLYIKFYQSCKSTYTNNYPFLKSIKFNK